MRESDALEGATAPDILSIIAGGTEKVRLRSGRETGLGHARERCIDDFVDRCLEIRRACVASWQ
jgi:hypothetical protein